MIANGNEVDEIANRTGVAIDTVHVYVRRVLSKTGTQAELVRLGFSLSDTSLSIRCGFIEAVAYAEGKADESKRNLQTETTPLWPHDMQYLSLQFAVFGRQPFHAMLYSINQLTNDNVREGTPRCASAICLRTPYAPRRRRVRTDRISALYQQSAAYSCPYPDSAE